MSRWLRERRDFVVVVLAAAVLRLVYGLVLHPPHEHRISDMGGYLDRGERLFDAWVDPMLTFYPYGTHVAIGVGYALGGDIGVDVLYALLGTAAVAYSFLAAERLMPEHPIARNAVGLLLVVHVTWVQLGGFAVSEVPFACALAAAVFYSLRTFDEGRARDGLWAGVALACAITIRPQALFALVLLLAHVLRRREAWRQAGASLRTLAAFIAPIALILALSSARFWYHSGTLGLVSSNGAMNLAFGRCHCETLSARGTRGSSFGIPVFGVLKRYEEKHGFRPLVELDPAIKLKLRFDGRLWEQRPALALAGRCMKKTGALKQVRYSLGHVVLLWAYNRAWPTLGLLGGIWQVLQALWLPGLAIALGRGFAKSHAAARMALLTAHVWGLLLTALIFFGDARLRAPYDGIIITLAIAVLAPAAASAWDGWRARRKAAP